MLKNIDPQSLLALAAIVLSACMAIVALFAKRGRPDYRLFAAGMFLLAVEGVFSLLCMGSNFSLELKKWEYLRMVAGSLIPFVWLIFSVCYAREDAKALLGKWKWVFLCSALLPVFLVLWFRDSFFLTAKVGLSHNWVVLFGRPAYLYNVLFLVCAILIVFNLEKTLRMSFGDMRWRIKFMLLGIGSIFAARIYTTSEKLLYSGDTSLLSMIESGTLFFADILVIVSLLRTRLRSVSVYVSHDFLYNSITIVIVGIYLLVLGVVARIAQYFGAGEILLQNAFLVFIALVGIVVLLFSSSIKHGVKKFISTHFNRLLHDYKKVWSSLTERTVSLVNIQDVCSTVAKLISETLEVASVSIWLRDEIEKRPELFGSTHLSSHDLEPGLKNEIKFLMMSLRDKNSPVMLNLHGEERQEFADAEIAQPGLKGLIRCGVPLVAGGQFLGIITLGTKLNNEEFTLEDLDLLKTIANQAAGFILNHKLFESLGQAREMEAFQTLSTFFVHDLKNLASTLSITLQNLPMHYDNPEFRQDALRVMAGSVQKIQDMCGRLSSFNQRLDLNYVETDLNDLVLATLSGFESSGDMVIERETGSIPAVHVDRDKIRSVLMNLILNAREASAKDCRIRIATAVEDGYAVVSVRDNGCGISREFMDKELFRPFKSTKSKGLGIGLFQSRTIVQAHQGKIVVESEEGKGSEFRILLPVSSTDKK